MGDLKIEIIEARDLVAADRNGMSDPFVTVEILEDPTQGKQKTKVHHKVCQHRVGRREEHLVLMIHHDKYFILHCFLNSLIYHLYHHTYRSSSLFPPLSPLIFLYYRP